MKILVTGFDAFGKETVNPASQVLKQLRAPEGVELVKLEIPTVYGSGARVIEAIEACSPDAVVSIGLAGGRSAVTPERVAINVRDCSLKDNLGRICQEEPVVPAGPAAYFSTLPIKKIVAAMEKEKIPAQISNTAGTFVCNSLLYEVLDYCSRRAPKIRAGFLHVPFLPCQTEHRPQYPSMPLSQMTQALEAALSAISEG